MRIVVVFLGGRLGRRTVGRRLRIIEIVLNGGRFGTDLRHLTGHCRTRMGSFRRVSIGIACRLSGLLRAFLYRTDARTARIGVEAGIAVKDEIIAVTACRILCKQHCAAALIGILGKRRRLWCVLRGLLRARRLRGIGRRSISLCTDRIGRRRIRRRPRRGIGLSGRGLLRHGCVLGLGQIVKGDGLMLLRTLRTLVRTRPCRGKQDGAKRGHNENEPQRQHDEQ